MTARDEDWGSDDALALFDAVAAAGTRQEAAAFLRDLCTRRELEEMISRWAVARLLARGLSYREVSQATGVSTTTITRINEWLRHGTGGYRRMLTKLGYGTEGDL